MQVGKGWGARSRIARETCAFRRTPYSACVGKKCCQLKGLYRPASSLDARKNVMRLFGGFLYSECVVAFLACSFTSLRGSGGKADGLRLQAWPVLCGHVAG